MLEKFIPSSSIILFVNDQIADDYSYTVHRDDTIRIDMVRAYQLPEYCNMLGIWENDAERDKENRSGAPVYTAQMLKFNDSGISEIGKVALEAGDFVQWLERKFVDGVLSKNLINDGDQLCLALSGGRDSLALLYLLQKTRDQLPDFHLFGCTVAPTAASRADVEIAAEAIAGLGVNDHFIMDMEDVKSIFNLETEFNTAINKILLRSGRGRSIASWHSIMRTCVESFARSRNLRKIVFGYQHEDLVASIMRSQSLGLSFGESPYKKKWADFEIICPLWPITKKELTIYLSVEAPRRHVSQGSPTNFDRGDHNRDLNYFISDVVSSTVPGYGYQILEGAEMIGERVTRHVEHSLCANCGGVYQRFHGDEAMTNEKYCGTCTYLNEIGEVRFLRPVVP